MLDFESTKESDHKWLGTLRIALKTLAFVILIISIIFSIFHAPANLFSMVVFVVSIITIVVILYALGGDMRIIHWFFGGSENWLKNWLRYSIYIGLSILIIVSFFVGWFGKMIIKNQNIYYLLSSISQGLATVFALIVTMRLVIVTSILSTKNKNTAIDKLIKISPSELTFYVFFVITIALPLWLMYSNRICTSLVKLSLAFAFICLIGIINSAFSFIGIIRNANNLDIKKRDL